MPVLQHRTDALHTARLPWMGQKIPAQKQGRRVCGERNCTTVLSRYNLSEWCYAHDRDEPVKRMKDRVIICESCRVEFRAAHPMARTCSDACRNRAQRARRRSA